MAQRPIYIPTLSGSRLVRAEMVEFQKPNVLLIQEINH